MKRLMFLIPLLFVAGCAASKPVPIRQGPAIAAPAYKAGEEWTYHTTGSSSGPQKIRITATEGKFKTDNEQMFEGTIWATVYRPDFKSKHLSFPLTPGKTWAYSYRHTSPTTGRTSKRNAKVTVIGPTAQPVKTQAGQFRVTELSRTETWGSAQRTTTYFYSPETKSVVKLTATLTNSRGTSSYTMELVKYSPKQ